MKMTALFKMVLGAHDCYSGFDPAAPDAIKDRNGEVVLGLCKVCGAGEIELEEPCDERLARLDALHEQRDRQLLRDQRP
jgi:hypothetical protein